MGLIPLKCPNCGGTVQFDENLSKGFCIYCGTPIVNDKNSTVNINTVDIQNIRGNLEKARICLMKSDVQGAREYSEMALQTGSEYPDCWILHAITEFDDAEMKQYYVDKAKKCQWGTAGHL